MLGADDRELKPYLIGWRGYFGFCHTPRAHEPGNVDSPKITLVSLAAVAERAQPLHGTAPSWRTDSQQRSTVHRRDIRNVNTPGRSTLTQPVLRFNRSPRLYVVAELNRSNRRGTARMPGGCGGWCREASPLSRSMTLNKHRIGSTRICGADRARWRHRRTHRS